jgi:DNA/RNA-binding domain of Phe-tRNA-synthetase-like protein
MTQASRIQVSPSVRERYPGFRLSVVFAWGVRNASSTSESRLWLRAGAEEGLSALRGGTPKDHLSIKNWRDAYSGFGAKPSAYPCSSESLIQRVSKGGVDAVPAINVLVDAYNAISMSNLLPVGGEDLDKTVGTCELRFAGPADCLAEGEDTSNVPDPGEVIWADDVGWTCRRWNWRQGTRNRLTEHTRNAFFLVEGMASPTYEPDVGGAANMLRDRISRSLNPDTLEVLHLVSSAAQQGSYRPGT